MGGTFILCVTNSNAQENICPADTGIDLTLQPQIWLWVPFIMVIVVPLVWLRKTEKLAFTHIFADIMVLVGLVTISIYAT